MRYSVIIPVYNRPDEVDELLQSLTAQYFKDFEVVVVEDGSSIPCKEITDRYISLSQIQDRGKHVTTERNAARVNTLLYWILM